jgi:hypothetical protein
MQVLSIQDGWTTPLDATLTPDIEGQTPEPIELQPLAP